MSHSQSIIELLKADHQKVQRMFGDLETIDDAELEGYFCELREELVRHEVAEEVVVYPALRKNAPNGESVAAACVAEQSQAEETLASMEKVQEDPAVLRPMLVALRSAVLEHAGHEEREVLPLLERSTAPDELIELGRRYETSLAAAPTHPHPHSPDTPPGNVVVGPVAALLDKVRDAMRGAA